MKQYQAIMAEALALSKESILPANEIAHLAYIARSHDVTATEQVVAIMSRAKSCYRDSSVSIDNASNLQHRQRETSIKVFAGTVEYGLIQNSCLVG
jgi:hypothetical protein